MWRGLQAAVSRLVSTPAPRRPERPERTRTGGSASGSLGAARKSARATTHTRLTVATPLSCGAHPPDAVGRNQGPAQAGTFGGPRRLWDDQDTNPPREPWAPARDDDRLVGASGFEPPTSSQTRSVRRINRLRGRAWRVGVVSFPWACPKAGSPRESFKEGGGRVQVGRTALCPRLQRP